MKTKTTTEIISEVYDRGFCFTPGLLEPQFIQTAKAELLSAIEKEAAFHGTTNHRDYGMVLLCALYGGSFLRLFENDSLLQPLNALLGEGCIVYAYTSSSMPPGDTNYSGRIHVDCPRIIPNYITNIGVTITLDDFTEDNGATYFLPYSQKLEVAPCESEFYSKAERFIAPAGSVCFFNARTWHAGGKNVTTDWRHALTINMCRSYMKQRIDIPRALRSELDISGIPEGVLQKLGFRSQPPASYNEYYAPKEERTFRQQIE